MGRIVACTCEWVFMKPQPQLFAAERASKSSTHVEISSVATAVPEHVTGQQEIAERAHKIFPQFARLDALYNNTGIERRYSVEPKEWYLQPHTWEERTESYQRTALDLLERVASASGGRGGAQSARHRHHRHQHDHRPRDPEPRGPPHEPPRLPPRRGAAADLRARLRRRASAVLLARRAWPRRGRAPTFCS